MMTTGERRFNWLRDFPWQPAFWLIAQTIGVVIVLVRLSDRVGTLERDHDEITKSITQLDTSGSRGLNNLSVQQTANTTAITTLTARIQALDARDNMIIQTFNDSLLKTAQEAVKVQGQIEVLKIQMQRVEEQQSRIIQALDNTYSMLQEHMRSDNGSEIKNKKLKK